MSNSSILLIERVVTRSTIPGQSGHESNCNEGVLHNPQSSWIGASPSDGSMSYPGLCVCVSYPSAEIQSVYSTAPADWAFLGNCSSFRKFSCSPNWIVLSNLFFSLFLLFIIIRVAHFSIHMSWLEILLIYIYIYIYIYTLFAKFRIEYKQLTALVECLRSSDKVLLTNMLYH